MEKYYAYKYLLNHSKTINFSMDEFLDTYEYSYDHLSIKVEPHLIDYNDEMDALFKLLSNPKRREIVLQAFYLNNSCNDNYLEESSIDEKTHIYRDRFTDDFREQISIKCIEFDTAIGLIINLYYKFLRIQEVLCEKFPDCYEHTIICNPKTKEKIKYFDSLLEEKNIDHVRDSVSSEIESIIHTNFSKNYSIDELLWNQWIIIGISHCLYNNEVNPTQSLIKIYDRWIEGIENDREIIVNLNEICDSNDDFNERNLIENFSKLSYHMFYVLRTVLSKKLYDYYNYFCS